MIRFALIFLLMVFLVVISVSFLRADYRHSQEIWALKLELGEAKAKLTCLGKPVYRAAV